MPCSFQYSASTFNIISHYHIFNYIKRQSDIRINTGEVGLSHFSVQEKNQKWGSTELAKASQGNFAASGLNHRRGP